MKLTEQEEQKLVRGMVDSGMLPMQAVSVMLAMQFASEHAEFAEQYGTFTKDNLDAAVQEMLNKV